MALGIETNTIAPGLIMQSGKMLSDNIRDIGKQVQSSIFEINTKKDLAAMAQEIQAGAVIPQSENFAQDAVAFGFRHPLAIQDPRGQMALNVLGKAHSEWRQGQLAQQRINPYRSMAGGGIYDSSTGEIVTPPSGRPGSSKGYSAVPGGGGILNRDTGEVQPLPVGAGKPAGGLTPYQAAQFKVNSAKSVLSGVNSKIAPLEKQYNSLVKEQAELEGDTDNRELHTPRLRQIYDSLKNVGSQLESLGKERAAREQDLQGAFQEVNTPQASVAPDASLGGIVPETLAPTGDIGVLPPQGAVATPVAGANVRRVPVLDPNGTPLNLREDQLESALKAGWKRR